MRNVRCSLLWFALLVVTNSSALGQLPSSCSATATSIDSVPFMFTGWTSAVTLDKFDPDLGTLTGVRVTLTGTIFGEAAYESLQNKPSAVNLTFSANLSVFRPGGVSLITGVVPQQQFQLQSPAYDNVFDFGGTSGNTFSGITAVATGSHASPTPVSDLSLFMGIAGVGPAGTITLPVVATGTSTGTRGGNLILQFTQAAMATVEVRYTYDASCDSLCNGDGGDQLGCTNCPCGNNAPAGTIGGCLNSAASSARLNAMGDLSVSLPPNSTTDLRFSLSGAPPIALCLLTSGDAVAPLNMGNPCFGNDSGAQALAFDGLRCAVSGTLRHGVRGADANGDVGALTNPWGGEANPPAGLAHASGGFVAGQTRYFQAVNRDDATLGCMRGLNTTQAIRVTFAP